MLIWHAYVRAMKAGVRLVFYLDDRFGAWTIYPLAWLWLLCLYAPVILSELLVLTNIDVKLQATSIAAIMFFVTFPFSFCLALLAGSKMFKPSNVLSKPSLRSWSHR
jgi:hypothetical protein